MGSQDNACGERKMLGLVRKKVLLLPDSRIANYQALLFRYDYFPWHKVSEIANELRQEARDELKCLGATHGRNLPPGSD